MGSEAAVSEGNGRRGITGSGLKYIAIITMLIDHIGATVMTKYVTQSAEPESYALFLGIYFVLRIIGRVAFPIFCFLLVEGFIYTHSRKQYLLRLWAFALISEIPFDLALYDSPGMDFTSQNVFFTLFLGFFAMMLLEQFKEKRLLQVLSVFGCAALAFVLSTDYGPMGVLLIVLFYLFRGNKAHLYLAVAVWLLIGQIPQQVLQLCLHPVEGYSVLTYLTQGAIPNGLLELFGAISLIFIAKYKGQKGRSLPKYFFYAFYPVHLLILWAISTCI